MILLPSLKFVPTKRGMEMGWQEEEIVDRKISQVYTLQQITV